MADPLQTSQQLHAKIKAKENEEKWPAQKLKLNEEIWEELDEVGVFQSPM